MDNDLTLKAAALKLGFVTEQEFDRIVDPAKDGQGPTSQRRRISPSAGTSGALGRAGGTNTTGASR